MSGIWGNAWGASWAGAWGEGEPNSMTATGGFALTAIAAITARLALVGLAPITFSAIGVLDGALVHPQVVGALAGLRHANQGIRISSFATQRITELDTARMRLYGTDRSEEIDTARSVSAQVAQRATTAGSSRPATGNTKRR